MSVLRVTQNDVESFTLVASPNRSYTSSSSGVTGSVRVFPRQSSLEKDTQSSFLFNESNSLAAVDLNFDSTLKKINDESRSKRQIGVSIERDVESYLDLVQSTPTKKTAVLDVERFTPTTRFTKYTLIKNNVKDVLMPHYRVDYPDAHWAYSNYNSLNFFTAASGSHQLIPTGSVLLYPNILDAEVLQHAGYVSGSYCLSGAFSFDFYINPRYQHDDIDEGHFKAGTIFHLSSSYSLSLVTGSLKDKAGLPSGFRLQLHLSHSADYSPSEAAPGPYPRDLIFLSDDNSLAYNNWHHVVVRWGTNLINDGTGSFVVDGVEKGIFIVPSGTISPRVFTSSNNPDVLCVGNFYKGTNSGSSAQNLFFGTIPATRDGVVELVYNVTKEGPDHYSFDNPLKAEVHDLSIRRHYMTDSEIEFTGSIGHGVESLAKDNFALYVPPFFVEQSPIRRNVNGTGGILQTPFIEVDGTTDDPFNVAMAFGVNGHYINLENFTKDFTNGVFPRLMSLSGSAIDHTTDAEEANNFLYSSGNVAKRNLTILPCDDGDFDPNYEILSREAYVNKYVNPLGVQDFSYINLDNLISTSSLTGGGIPIGGSDQLVGEAYGPTPENPGLEPGPSLRSYINSVSSYVSSVTDDNLFDRGIQSGAPLTIYQRTGDPSSNQVTFFNISNLYYGRRIQPGTFEIKDVGISGSYGKVGITLRDDSIGNLYRSDSFTPNATHNSVGNIFYDEGIVVIKSPHLYFFGKNQYEISFRGVQNIYTQKYEILAGPGLLNSSSNPTNIENYQSLKPSGNVKDTEPFVYISGLNFHDENMNVVAKARLAQPIIKREGDKILFKVAFDW